MIRRMILNRGLCILISMVALGRSAGGVVHVGITPESAEDGVTLTLSRVPKEALPKVARKPAAAGRLAQADLAERIGVDLEEIAVIEILWTEISAHQLQRGRQNRKAVAPAEYFGYQVTLRVREKEHLYYVRLLDVVYVGSR